MFQNSRSRTPYCGISPLLSDVSKDVGRQQKCVSGVLYRLLENESAILWAFLSDGIWETWGQIIGFSIQEPRKQATNHLSYSGTRPTHIPEAQKWKWWTGGTKASKPQNLLGVKDHPWQGGIPQHHLCFSTLLLMGLSGSPSQGKSFYLFFKKYHIIKKYTKQNPKSPIPYELGDPISEVNNQEFTHFLQLVCPWSWIPPGKRELQRRKWYSYNGRSFQR